MTSSTSPVDIRPDHLEIVQDILRERLPAGFQVWVFGSRAKWAATDASDLDLAVEGADALDYKTMVRLEVAFEESDLPYTVDVVDLNAVSKEFKKIVEVQRIPLPPAATKEASGEWREVPLGEVTNFLSGGTPSKSRADYWNGSIPWVSAKDMKQLRLHETQDYLSDEGVKNGTRVVPANTVLLLVRGMSLLNDVPMSITQRAMAFNQDIKALCPESEIDEDFLPYAILGNKPRLLSLVDLAGHGTGRLNTGDLKAIKVRLPPLPEQRAIARILGALDDKIELNRRMNQTLEAMARAIFQDWFVDFGPVRAKLEGREPYLPQELWDLFPDRLVDSELGEIPEGWEVKALVELVELAYGKALKAEDRKGGPIQVYGSNGQVGWHDKKLVSGPGIVVGRKGNPGVVTWAHSDFYPIDTAFYVVPTAEDLSLHFLLYALIGQDLPSVAADSAVPGLNRNLAYMNSQIVPDTILMDAFGRYVAPIFERRHRLDEESRTLAAQRDAVLPRLVSGELELENG